MRAFDQPLPGDLVIRHREDRSHIRAVEVWVITQWPDAETSVAGPYLSYAYALQQAKRLVRDRSEKIWRDHARRGQPEQLEHVV